MSLDVLTAIWRAPPCKAGDLLCLLAIADNADDFGYAWPSVSLIAKKAAMSERGAQKCIKKLVEMGLITVESGGGRNKTNAYQITTNGIGPNAEHQNPEQNSPNTVHPLRAINPEQSDINPEQSDTKPRTPVHPNRKEPSKEPSVNKKTAKTILSEVVGEETADAFLEMRTKIKKPMTEYAAQLMAKKLVQMSDPKVAMERSILNSWQDVYPPNKQTNNAVDAAMQEVFGNA